VGSKERIFAFIERSVGAMTDPRLAALSRLFLTEFGERFRRAAAARHEFITPGGEAWWSTRRK
jgi:hypothetical protein